MSSSRSGRLKYHFARFLITRSPSRHASSQTSSLAISCARARAPSVSTSQMTTTPLRDAVASLAPARSNARSHTSSLCACSVSAARVGSCSSPHA